MTIDEARRNIGSSVKVGGLIGKLMAIYLISPQYYGHVDLAADSRSFPLEDIELVDRDELANVI